MAEWLAKKGNLFYEYATNWENLDKEIEGKASFLIHNDLRTGGINNGLRIRCENSVKMVPSAVFPVMDAGKLQNNCLETQHSPWK